MKTLIIFISLFLSLNLNGQKGKLLLSSWNDNVNSDYKVPAERYLFNKNARIFYAISNNNDNLYVDLKIEDSGTQNRILQQGLSIWVNMDGKHLKKKGIHYPIGSKNRGGSGTQGPAGANINTDGSPISPLLMANTIELIGFTTGGPRFFPSDNVDNFRGSVEYDKQGLLFYRMVMPISKLDVRNAKAGDGALPFTLGIEYGAFPDKGQPERGGVTASQQDPPSPGPRGGSSGGGRGGGGRQGSGVSMNNPANSAPSSLSKTDLPVLLWIKNIKLASDK